MSIFEKLSLHNKVALITGGAGLLGVKHAEAIAETGGVPVLIDIDQKKLDQLTKDCGFETYCCDITKKDELLDLLDWVIKKFNRLDIVINNAAINPKVENVNGLEGSRLEHYSLGTFERELSVGLTAAFLCTQIFGNYMSKNGRGGVILNVASDLGLIAPNQNLYKIEGRKENEQPVKPVSYSVIKHGLIGLTRYTATYWADKGIRCNALAPGGVENGQNNIFLSRIKELIPMGRMAHPDEYKAAVAFLVSEASSYMNGAILSVDGGRTAW
ncbi:MAG: SDR family oxidoreductase [Alphaproteobacteria bacterium]|nr:SDR family oxidoreductase [Alphaproteobacteria bacterium]